MMVKLLANTAAYIFIAYYYNAFLIREVGLSLIYSLVIVSKV